MIKKYNRKAAESFSQPNQRKQNPKKGQENKHSYLYRPNLGIMTSVFLKIVATATTPSK